MSKEEEVQDRDEWLWAYTLVLGILNRHPGWETAKETGAFAAGLKDMEAATRAKQLNRELDKLRDLNEDKFATVQAYCRMASWDKWKIQKLIDGIDLYLSAAGHGEHTKLLTEARAEVVNSKTGMFP